MTDPETPEEQLARRFFEAAQLEVIRIPSAPTATADYLVNGDGPGYVVEVKSRNDDMTLRSRLTRGDVVDGARRAAHDPAIERVARSARRQFALVDPGHARMWVLWFSLDAQLGADASFNQCVGTLYGVRQCVCADDAGNATSIDCYYARPGVFERWTEIDGVIVASRRGFSMFANELSPRFSRLRQLRVPIRLERAFHVPTELETGRRILLADRQIDRRSETLLQAELAERYSLKRLFIVDFTHAWAATLADSATNPRRGD